jgi:hypothetical protein
MKQDTSFIEISQKMEPCSKSHSKPNGSKRKPEPELTKVQVPGS